MDVAAGNHFCSFHCYPLCQENVGGYPRVCVWKGCGRSILECPRSCCRWLTANITAKEFFTVPPLDIFAILLSYENSLSRLIVWISKVNDSPQGGKIDRRDD